VVPANASPVITSADHTTLSIGTAGSFTVTTTAGYPAATTITKIGSLPAGVTFTDNGDGTGTLAGTPAAGTAGSYPLTLTASNSAGSTQQSFTLTVGKKSQVTTFGTLPDRLYGAANFTLTASATSQLPITFTSNSTSVCTVSRTTVTLRAAGTCGITASQAGDATWQAASPVTRTFTVGYTVSNLAPPNKSQFKAGSTIPVKFQLAGAGGQVIANTLAATLGCSVTASFNGGTPVCATYVSKSRQFQVDLVTPSNLSKNTDCPILITVKVGSTTVATATVTVTTK
jgi:hypothetical protein